jgi:hypothetical protein
VSRWQPPHPDLRRIRVAVQGKLVASQLRAALPGQRGYSPQRDEVKYEVCLSRVVATGEIICNIKVSNFEQLAADPADRTSVIRWMFGPGRDLIAQVDRIVARHAFHPVPITGRTLLIPDLAEVEDERTRLRGTA